MSKFVPILLLSGFFILIVILTVSCFSFIKFSDGTGQRILAIGFSIIVLSCEITAFVVCIKIARVR